jgi:ketosteroid isomerase-like protein
MQALNRGDFDAVLEAATADFEYDLSRTDSPLRGVYRGRDEALRVGREFMEPWESVHYEVHELIDAGDHVVTPYTSHFRGRDGIEVVAHATWVWTFRAGRATRVCLYQHLEDALRAVQ